ncbi:BMP family ABC transporter substrate-binding protein [Streptomyces sp. NPDC059352]|uniref:BMP family ABC transporter substrate-binding protein n=1 Tax=Streptomyces sp. NPDC059352 TaxID=3346810 RepID=UPI0036B96CE7
MKTRRTWRNSAGKNAPETGARIPGLPAAAAGALRGRAGWAVAAVVVLVLGLFGARLFAGSDDGSTTPPDTRAREYQDFDACLLTGEKGIVAGAPAEPVWEGMRTASEGEGRPIRVTFVPVMGEQSTANARPFLNGLVQRDCEIVLASGASQVTVAEEAAEKNPKVRFVVIDQGAGDGRGEGRERDNLARLTPGPALAEEVAKTVARIVDGD